MAGGEMAGLFGQGPLFWRSRDHAKSPDAAAVSLEKSSATGDYKLAPEDTLVVDVVGEKDLSKLEFKVSSSGVIIYPFIGELKVAGLTAVEVTSRIKELLDKDYIVNPQVTVMVKEYRKRFITVTGEVTKPGALELPAEQKWTIVDAIGQAGGTTKAANSKRIEFTRAGIRKKFRLDDLQKTTDPKKIIYLEPGDNINVPQTIW
jgi:polysaccharide export outer membrane protein